MMPRPRRRVGARNMEEDDAAKGNLGEEFSDINEQTGIGAQALMIAEVRALLARNMEETGKEAASNPVLQKTLQYTELFSHFKEESTVREVRNKLLTESHGILDQQIDEFGNIIEDETTGLALTGYEMAQLANLGVEDVEEAKTLIPTLADKDNTRLERLLEELSTMRKFQS